MQPDGGVEWHLGIYGVNIFKKYVYNITSCSVFSFPH